MQDMFIKAITQHYNIQINHFKRHRHMIGDVYFINTNHSDFVVKIYKPKLKAMAERSILVMHYLSSRKGPVPKVILTKEANPFIDVNNHLIFLTERIDGEEVHNIEDDFLINQCHREFLSLMGHYKGELITRNHAFYVERFIKLLIKNAYPKEKRVEMKDMGDYFFDQIKYLPKGICHGDFHTGNLIKYKNQIYLLDFDAIAYFSSHIDLVTMNDLTDFNQYRREDLVQIIERLKQIIPENGHLIKPLMAFIPLRHFELIATIAHANGFESMTESFLNQQYDWVKSFYDDYCKFI
jgi:Ser/Thr protein kinase RdoA (MazF antagonist)